MISSEGNPKRPNVRPGASACWTSPRGAGDGTVSYSPNRVAIPRLAEGCAGRDRAPISSSELLENAPGPPEANP